MRLTNEDFQEILNISMKLSTEKNKDLLLTRMVHAGLNITRCDAGTLYLFEDGVLVFDKMITLSQNVHQGENGEKISLPPVQLREENVCAYAAIHRKTVNISDVYHSEEFDFSGPKRYDSMTGYHTRSMLVVPLVNAQEELLGVLQLLNAMDEEGRVIPFYPEYVTIIEALGSLAAIELTNLAYLEEIKDQQISFVEAMTTAIDQRTPYNGTHSRKVAGYAVLLAQYIEKLHRQGLEKESYSQEQIDRIRLAGLLHDVGKMIVPLSVMNRTTRLEQEMERIEERFKLLKAYVEIDYLEGKSDEAVRQTRLNELQEDLELIRKVNDSGFLDDETFEKVQMLSKKEYCFRGERIPYLTEEESVRLQVRKGTLTAEDRVQMENHVVMTETILERVRFRKDDVDIPKWAAEHHELLDGSGYPGHLKGDEICAETRILTVADVYDALTASDRPYKKPIPKEKAFSILRNMAAEGKLELRLVNYLEQAIAGEN